MSRNVLIVKAGNRLVVNSAAVAAHLADGWSLDVNWDLNDAPQWDDLRFPVAGINPPGAASAPARDTTDGRLHFSASAVNIIAIQVQMPHAWKLDSAIFPHLHWSPSTTNTGNCLWKLQYKIANIGDVFPASWSESTVLDAGGGVVDGHQLAAFSDIDMTGYNLSCMLLMLVSRLGSDPTDTFTGEAILNEVDIHYQLDALGSNEMLTK